MRVSMPPQSCHRFGQSRAASAANAVCMLRCAISRLHYMPRGCMTCALSVHMSNAYGP